MAKCISASGQSDQDMIQQGVHRGKWPGLSEVASVSLIFHPQTSLTEGIISLLSTSSSNASLQEERLHSSSRGMKTYWSFCGASRNASEGIPSPNNLSAYAPEKG